ncbi:MAG TPA: peroxidase [Planctomycetes bacterium]|nr:peroxidase [Planctomycetota bacterium]
MKKEGAEASWVDDLAEDWRSANLPEADAALCAFAEKLTKSPAGMQEEDLAGLRAHGFDDAAIHEAIQVIAYFNYINRVADATHVDLEPEMAPYPSGEGQ